MMDNNNSDAWKQKQPVEWDLYDVQNWATTILQNKPAPKTLQALADCRITGRSLLGVKSAQEFITGTQIVVGDGWALYADFKERQKQSSQYELYKSIDLTGALIYVTRAQHDELKKLKDCVDRILSQPRLDFPGQEKFAFEVPVGSASISQWQGLTYPPFFNREQAILELLNDCFNNYQAKASKKTYTIAATSPGFGKTRLLVEWGIRVFHTPIVLSSFLLRSQHLINEKEITLADLQATKEQRKDHFKAMNYSDEAIGEIEERLTFLGQLHKTLSQKRVITTSAFMWGRDNDPVKVCQKILHKAIQHQWPVLLVNNKVLEASKLTDQVLKELFPAKSPLEALYLLFQQAADQIPYVPVFPGIEMSPTNEVTLLNIDECQNYTNVKVEERNMAYHVTKIFNELKITHILMVGLKTGNLEEMKDPTVAFLRSSLPLNPLKDEKYLSNLCSSVMHKYYNEEYKQEGDTDELAEATKSLLHRMWVKTFGIPRAIEFLFSSISSNKYILSSKDPQNAELQKVENSLMLKLKSYFMEQHANPPSNKKYALKKKDWQRLLVECSLCLPKTPDDIIGNSKQTYAKLETEILFPFEFVGSGQEATAKRCYTMPFHYFTELCQSSIDLFPIPNNIDHVNFTIDHIVGSSGLNSNNMTKEDGVLECAVAATLWAQYQLHVTQLGEFVPLSAVFPSWPSNHFICLSGVTVVQAIEDITKDSLLNIIFNKKKTSFADAIVPLYSTNHRNTASHLLCIKCYNVENNSELIKPVNLANNIEALDLPAQPHLIWMFISPNINAAPISVQLTQAKEEHPYYKQLVELEQANQVVISNGDHWLSPLFIFAYRNSLLEQQESDTKQKVKRKHDEDEINLSPPVKKTRNTQGNTTK